MTTPTLRPIDSQPRQWIRWAVGMTTAPRQQSKLVQSIESVQAAGWPEVFVFSEPGEVGDLPSGAILTQHAKTWGPWANFRIGLRTLVRQYAPWCDYFVMFQDDIVVARNLAEHLESALLGESHLNAWEFRGLYRLGVISLYTSQSNHSEETGWRQLTSAELPRCARGALGYVFSRESAIDLIDNPPNPNDFAGVDANVGSWCKRTGRSYLIHSPSYIAHTGSTSTIPDRDNGRNRQCHELIVDCRTREVRRYSDE